MILLTFKEFFVWTDIKVLELWTHVVTIYISSILLLLKLENNVEMSYTMVAFPIIAGTAFNAYYLFICFMRSYVEGCNIAETCVSFVTHFLRNFTIYSVVQCGAYRLTEVYDGQRYNSNVLYEFALNSTWLNFLILFLRLIGLLIDIPLYSY